MGTILKILKIMLGGKENMRYYRNVSGENVDVENRTCGSCEFFEFDRYSTTTGDCTKRYGSAYRNLYINEKSCSDYEMSNDVKSY